jgi:hypothetical protein
MKRLSMVIGTVILALFTATQVYAISMGISPSSQTVSQGDTFSVELFISGLGDNVAPPSVSI